MPSTRSSEWVQSDMRDFVRPGAFDLALSMYTSFGYFDDKRDDVTVLRHMLGSLRPGGAALIDVVGKETLARIYQSASVDVGGDGTRLVRRHEVFDDWTRVRNEWMLVRGDRVTTFAFHHTVYSGQELREMMQRAGFADVRLYGNFDGAAYDLNAARLIATGRRPD